MDITLMAVGCGTCGLVIEAEHVPDWCSGCRARWYRHDSALVLVWMTLRTAVDGTGVRLEPGLLLDYRGRWPLSVRGEVDARVHDLVARLR